MEIVYSPADKRYIARSNYDERAVAKAAGFRWDPVAKKWWTQDLAAVAKVEQYLSPTAREAFAAAHEVRQAAVSASRAAEADIAVPKPDGLDYLPFQKAGIAYALSRPNTLIGDDMGLGKTIQALGVVNADPSIHHVLIVSPLSVAINWQREADKWLTRPHSVGIATAKKLPETADIVICHWGIVAKHARALRERSWDLIVLDESHYAKNSKAARTKAILGDFQTGMTPLLAKRQLALTGTPIPNRPVELYPVARWLNPGEFGNWKHFVTRYCNAYQSRYGWDVSGASHLDELQEKLRASVMIRRLKKDVLKELPPKIRQVVVIGADTSDLKKALKAEQAVTTQAEKSLTAAQVAVEFAKTQSEDAYQSAAAKLRQASTAVFTEMSQVRHATALAKVPQVLSHVQDVLAEDGAKVVLFAHHRDVVASLKTGLEAGTADSPGVKVVEVMGGMSPDGRQAAIDAFQNDVETRVFVATIDAAKEGITLTASHTAVFAELDWVPGNLSQAEDRIHRIGQRDACLIQHVLLDGSIDAKMAQTIMHKQEVIDQALDVQVAAGKTVAAADYHQGESGAAETDLLIEAAADAIATHSTSRDRIAKLAEAMTPDITGKIHDGLRQLAALDADYAQAKNGVGFGKLDADLGHQLAELDHLSPKQAALGAVLLHRYRRQLPAEYDMLPTLEAQANAKGPASFKNSTQEYEPGDD